MSTTYGAGLGLLLLPAAGCGDIYIDLFTCKNPDLAYIDAKGNPDPCHRDSPACRAAGLDADVKTCVEPVIDPTTGAAAPTLKLGRC
jgi:hypothetical protein